MQGVQSIIRKNAKSAKSVHLKTASYPLLLLKCAENAKNARGYNIGKAKIPTLIKKKEEICTDTN